MIPRMKILGVFARSDGELVADLIELPVECELENKVMLHSTICTIIHRHNRQVDILSLSHTHTHHTHTHTHAHTHMHTHTHTHIHLGGCIIQPDECFSR